MIYVLFNAFAAFSSLINRGFHPSDERGEGVVSSAVAVVIFSAPVCQLRFRQLIGNYVLAMS